MWYEKGKVQLVKQWQLYQCVRALDDGAKTCLAHALQCL